MPRFLGGFATASVLWAAFLYAYAEGYIAINLEPKGDDDAHDGDAGVADVDEQPQAGKRARRKRGGQRARPRAGDSLIGDDLGSADPRNLDVNAQGGEAQLRGDEIEGAFDRALPQVRRCLILAASDEPVTGKLVFGLRIAGSGSVSQVNLRGPNAITQSEAGDCLRRAASGIRFRSFDGPDMLVHFPMTLQ